MGLVGGTQEIIPIWSKIAGYLCHNEKDGLQIEWVFSKENAWKMSTLAHFLDYEASKHMLTQWFKLF